MVEVERLEQPVPTVVLERDGTKIGFAVNGGDASQDGAAVLVSNIQALKDEFEKTAQGSATGESMNGTGRSTRYSLSSPDGLCYYFYEPLSDPRDAHG